MLGAGYQPNAAWLVRVWPRDETNAEVEQRLSTHGFLSLATDSIGVAQFDALLASPPRLTIRTFAPGQVGGAADIGRGVIACLNPRDDDGNGPLEHWRALRWSGARYEAYRADGLPQPPASFDAYELTLRGRIERMEPGEGELLLVARDRRFELDDRVTLPRFRGIGPRVVKAVAANSASAGDVLDQTGSFSLGFVFKPTSISALNQQFLWKRSASGGYGVQMGHTAGNEGRMRFQIPGCTPEALLAPAGSALVAGREYYRVVCTYDHTSKVRCIYIDGELAVTDTCTGGPATNSNNLLLYSGVEGYVADWFIVSRALSADEVDEIGRGPFEADEVANTAEYWPGTEGSGTTLFGAKSVANATMSGGTWSVSGEGSSELLDQIKPLVLGGPALNVEPVIISQPDRVALVSYRGATTLGSVRSRGAILAEGAAGGATNYTKTLTPQLTITVHTLPGDPGVLTCDVTLGDDGDGVGWQATTLPGIIRLLTTVFGPLADGDLNADTFGVGKSSTWPNASPLELVITPGGPHGENLLEICADYALSQGAALLFDQLDELRLIELDPTARSASNELRWDRDFSAVQFIEILNPTLSQSVAYGRSYKTMTDQELVSSDSAMGSTALLGAAFRAFVKREQRARICPATKAQRDAASGAVHAPVASAGGYTRPRDAYAQARRMQRGWFGRNQLYGIALPFVAFIPGLEIGSVKNIIAPEIDGGAGRTMVLTGLDFSVEPYGQGVFHG